MLSSSAAAAASEQLSRQPSIYSLTLAELQHAMSHDPSKSLGSMNMEEFMRNLWTAEESQAMAAAMSNSTAFHIVNDHQNNNSNNSMSINGVLGRQSSLQRLMSLPPELSRNTVEEVWKDIQRQKVVAEASLLQQQPRREDTMAEMTLEDFLARVGMVRDELDSSSHITDTGNASMASSMYITPPVSGGSTHSASMDQSLTSHADWISYNTSQQPPHQQHHHHQQKIVQKTEHLGLHPSPMMLSTGTPLYNDRMADDLPDHSLTSTLALSPSAASDYTLSGSRKRFASDGIVYEKTMERRQKRMIKNRESAARSRARKQAYTVELETEVALLKEENAKLKQQQALESRLPETWHSQKRKVVLRRTQSC